MFYVWFSRFCIGAINTYLRCLLIWWCWLLSSIKYNNIVVIYFSRHRKKLSEKVIFGKRCGDCFFITWFPIGRHYIAALLLVLNQRQFPTIPHEVVTWLKVFRERFFREEDISRKKNAQSRGALAPVKKCFLENGKKFYSGAIINFSGSCCNIVNVYLYARNHHNCDYTQCMSCEQ